MAIIWVLLIGLVIGALAKLVMPGKDPGGIIVTSLLGIAGALVAAFLGRAFGFYQSPGDTPGILASVIGAVLILVVYRLIRRGRTGRPF